MTELPRVLTRVTQQAHRSGPHLGLTGACVAVIKTVDEAGLGSIRSRPQHNYSDFKPSVARASASLRPQIALSIEEMPFCTLVGRRHSRRPLLALAHLISHRAHRRRRLRHRRLRSHRLTCHRLCLRWRLSDRLSVSPLPSPAAPHTAHTATGSYNVGKQVGARYAIAASAAPLARLRRA